MSEIYRRSLKGLKETENSKAFIAFKEENFEELFKFLSFKYPDHCANDILKKQLNSAMRQSVGHMLTKMNKLFKAMIANEPFELPDYSDDFDEYLLYSRNLEKFGDLDQEIDREILSKSQKK